MISKKERDEMIVAAAKAVCANAGGNYSEDSFHYLEDVEVALAHIEPVLRKEITAEAASLQVEMDRLLEENERLISRIEDIEWMMS